MRRGRDERGLRGLGGLDVVAGPSQRGAQGAQDLRLVVDDEHSLAAHEAGTAAGTSRRAAPPRSVVPCSGRDSAQMRPPFASTKPRAIARPRPAPARSSPAPPVERLEHALEVGFGQAGALVDDSHDRLLARRRDAHVDDARLRRELDCVLDQVGQHALELGRIDTHQRTLAGDLRHAPRAPTESTAARTRSSSDQTSGAGAAPPASSRDRSSRSPTSLRQPLGVDVDRSRAARADRSRSARARSLAAPQPPSGSRSAASAGRARPHVAARS